MEGLTNNPSSSKFGDNVTYWPTLGKNLLIMVLFNNTGCHIIILSIPRSRTSILDLCYISFCSWLIFSKEKLYESMMVWSLHKDTSFGDASSTCDRSFFSLSKFVKIWRKVYNLSVLGNIFYHRKVQN